MARGMFIESTFMWYGHEKAGIFAITIKSETLKTLALSRHNLSQMNEDMIYLRVDTADKSQTTHKEEANVRITAERRDRVVIQRKLEHALIHLTLIFTMSAW